MLLAATVSLAGAGQPAEPFCRPRPEPPQPTRMEQHQAIRREFGFRTDEAYIRRLIRRGQWEYDIGYFPASRRENRYLRLRDRIELGVAASRYLRRRPNLSGGISIEDDWPRGPYILVRLTRDRARHTRELRRLARYPRNLRTVEVAVSYRRLLRIQERIDWDAARADGFHIATTGPDITTGKVKIELITRRTDHAAHFRDRYGPHVTTRVIATELTSPACASLFDYRLGPDGTALTVGYQAGGGARFDRVEVTETEDRVEIDIVVQVSNGPRTLDSRRVEHTVTLARRLGARRVVDASTGRTVRPQQR